MDPGPGLRGLIAASFTAVLLFLLGWYVSTVLLLAFMAVLFAIFAQGIAYAIANRTRLPYWACCALVILAGFTIIATAIALRAPAVADQIETLQQQLPQALQDLRGEISRYAWGRVILDSVRGLGATIQGGDSAIPDAQTIFSTVFTAFGHIIFVGFMFLFAAFEPRLYRRGLELLVPPGHRDRASVVLDRIWATLWWWLAARVIAMITVGVVTTIGLKLLGIPLAMTLGLTAALLDFVPNFGPIIAAAPAILFAAALGPDKALYVAALYLAIQIVEGNIITPLAQKKAIDMPPALVLGCQFVFGTLFGALGFIVATPLTAVGLVLVRELWVEPEART